MQIKRAESLGSALSSPQHRATTCNELSRWPFTLGKRELPEQAPDALLADKAYDTDAIRDDLKKRGIKAVIPPKSNRTATIRYSKRLYRERNCIERVIGHLKINRAIATRYDQL